MTLFDISLLILSTMTSSTHILGIPVTPSARIHYSAGLKLDNLGLMHYCDSRDRRMSYLRQGW